MAHDLDDDFAVYPFRRALVEETPAELPPARPRRVRPVAPSGPSPLKLAVPLALTTFLVALAGAATVSNRTEVTDAIVAQPASAAAPVRKQVTAPKPVFVPDVSGLKLRRALKVLKRADFHPRFRRVAGEPDVVLEQRPKAATEVRRAGVVVLLVGGARPKPRPKPAPAPLVTPTVIVTSVVGLGRTAAIDALLNEGLGVRVYGVPSSQPAGTVVAQSPRPGTRAEAGSYARINVSAG